MPSVKSKIKRRKRVRLAERLALALVEVSPAAVVVAVLAAKEAAAASPARPKPTLSIFLSRSYPRLPSMIAPSTEHVERPTAGCLLTLEIGKSKKQNLSTILA
jgi:hypothetical protein